MTASFPVDEVLPEVMTALRAERTCVLVAPTGAGKTTRLPPAVVDAGLGPVVALEPRRLAARAAARRVAHERGVRVGAEVGYQVRFDRRTSAATKITFVTEGIFVRRLQDDPFLEGIGCVVLDEFHERSLDLDLALALVRRVQLEVRPDLGLVVTSATLDADAVSAYLDGAPIVRSEGRLFPVAVEYLARDPRERDEEHVVRGVQRALDASDGDVLAFLPGTREIRRTCSALEGTARRRDIRVLQLHGSLPADEQDAVLEPRAERRVVVATNVAESSVTVPGVTAVVDSGLARTLRSDPAVGLDRLVLGRISAASADQRKGRAGREADGVCVRLWSPVEQRTLAAFDEPEVTRADLTGVALQLLAWGERDLATFPWFETPGAASIERALDLARMLGALASDGSINALGRTLVRIPAQPRLARLLLAGNEFGVLEHAAFAAALLGERDPWRRPAGLRHDEPRRGSESDVLDRVRALAAFEAGGAQAAPELHAGGAHACLAAKRQLERVARAALGGTPAAKRGDAADDAFLRALLAAFPDRLARRRASDPRRGVLVGGRGVRLAPQCAVDEGELFLAVELDAGRGEAQVRQASLVEREWVDGGRTHSELHCIFDPERGRVVGRKRVMLGELVLEDVEAPADDPALVETVLVGAARQDLARALDLARPDVTSLLARLRCLRDWCPELELPEVDDDFLAALLPSLAAGRRSFAELARAPLIQTIQGHLSQAQRSALERDAPERVTVPSGSRIRLDYEPGQPPVLAARIQELFGLRETPRVARGRVPVVMHLLAPNGRPQQVTEDLGSFWSGTYFEVRKELRRRYPKHDWPEDPTAAVARRRPGHRPDQRRGPPRGRK